MPGPGTDPIDVILQRLDGNPRRHAALPRKAENAAHTRRERLDFHGLREAESSREACQSPVEETLRGFGQWDLEWFLIVVEKVNHPVLADDGFGGCSNRRKYNEKNSRSHEVTMAQIEGKSEDYF